MRRTVVLVLISALALAGLTGCIPATEGAVGVRLDADGRLVGVFDWCRGKAGTDAIILYLRRNDGGVTDKVIQLERNPGRGAHTTEEIVLLDPAAGWQTKLTPPPSLDDGQIYELRAWNTNDDVVESFPFWISELRGQPGSATILTKRWEGGEDGGYVAAFHTPEEFDRYADTVVCGG